MDIATLLVSREKFARVCMEMDLEKPLMAGYRMRGDYCILQYEGLPDLFFGVGSTGIGTTHVKKKHAWRGTRKVGDWRTLR